MHVASFDWLARNGKRICVAISSKRYGRVWPPSTCTHMVLVAYVLCGRS